MTWPVVPGDGKEATERRSSVNLECSRYVLMVFVSRKNGLRLAAHGEAVHIIIVDEDAIYRLGISWGVEWES